MTSLSISKPKQTKNYKSKCHPSNKFKEINQLKVNMNKNSNKSNLIGSDQIPIIINTDDIQMMNVQSIPKKGVKRLFPENHNNTNKEQNKKRKTMITEKSSKIVQPIMDNNNKRWTTKDDIDNDNDANIDC